MRIVNRLLLNWLYALMFLAIIIGIGLSFLLHVQLDSTWPLLIQTLHLAAILTCKQCIEERSKA